jgi:hypothetical protein
MARGHMHFKWLIQTLPLASQSAMHASYNQMPKSWGRVFGLQNGFQASAATTTQQNCIV